MTIKNEIEINIASTFDEKWAHKALMDIYFDGFAVTRIENIPPGQSWQIYGVKMPEMSNWLEAYAVIP